MIHVYLINLIRTRDLETCCQLCKPNLPDQGHEPAALPVHLHWAVQGNVIWMESYHSNVMYRFLLLVIVDGIIKTSNLCMYTVDGKRHDPHIEHMTYSNRESNMSHIASLMPRSLANGQAGLPPRQDLGMTGWPHTFNCQRHVEVWDQDLLPTVENVWNPSIRFGRISSSKGKKHKLSMKKPSPETSIL